MVLPPWPLVCPVRGAVQLRPVEVRDVAMAQELSTDPYVPLTGSLPGDATAEEALAWVRRQQGRHAEGRGFSFAIARRSDDRAIGHCGLWLAEIAEGRATAGYAIAPSSRGHGHAADALIALTEIGWTLPGLQRITLLIEPWNTASLRTAEAAGYVREGKLAGYKEIGGAPRDMVVFAAIRPTAIRPTAESDSEDGS
ncbi:MAG: GNAT family N-acetyltransferase [Brevibacterium sp.]